MLVGTFLGTFAPWADHARIGANHLWWYLQPFLSIIVVQIFFMGSLFFMVAALTRKIFVVYLQGVALFMLYVIGITVFSATRSLEHFWSGILDPVGIDSVRQYHPLLDRHREEYPAAPVGFQRQLARRFPLQPPALDRRRCALPGQPVGVLPHVDRNSHRARRREARRKSADAGSGRKPAGSVSGRRPTAARASDLRSLQLASPNTVRSPGCESHTIFREVPFWAIVGLLIVFGVNNGHFAGRVGGVNVWPVTYLMLQAVEGSATLFLYIVAALYAAELIWRERDNHFDGIHDALPMSETTDWLSKFTAIALVEFVLLAVTMLVGIVMQTICWIPSLRTPASISKSSTSSRSRRFWPSLFSRCSSRPWSRTNLSATAS